jgi:hypothetical protein
MSSTICLDSRINIVYKVSVGGIGIDRYNKETVDKIFESSKNSLSSSYMFVDLINKLKVKFLDDDDYLPTQSYIRFIKYLLTNLELYSIEQLKIIERFCLRMDEDAVTGIVKYKNTDDTRDGYITCKDLSYLLKKYKIDNVLISEIIKKDYVNISNSLVNILAKNIRLNKQLCKYNGNCYRKNIEHLKTYFHN